MNLKINNLSFRYPRGKQPVLDGVSLDFSEGGVCGLLGPNGAGKSTLLYLIAGILCPTIGDITFNDTPTFLRRPAVLAKIYLVPEEPSLPRMSLKKFIALNAPFYPDFSMEIMKEALKEFDMFEPERLDSLSMGQKKKVVLSFALACRTPILLMDEPTNGLDIPGKAAFRRLVAHHASDDRLFLISTHQVRDLDQLLDRVMIMDTRRFILNQPVWRLQQYLSFGRNLREVPADALYSLPAIGGFDVITPNHSDDETEINLEILFETALKNTSALDAILKE